MKTEEVFSQRDATLLREYFNRHFAEMVALKERQMHVIAEKNERLRHIISEQNILAELKNAPEEFVSAPQKYKECTLVINLIFNFFIDFSRSC